MLFFFQACSNENKQRQTKDKAGINWEKVQDDFKYHRYSKVLSQIYTPFYEGNTDTFLAPIYISLTASQISRIYYSLFLFEKELGRKLYYLFLKNKYLTNSKKYNYFYSFYFFLSDSNHKALEALNNFSINLKNKKWNNDLQILTHFYKTNNWPSRVPLLMFNRILFNSLATYLGNKPRYPMELGKTSQLWQLTPHLLSSDSSKIIENFRKISQIKTSESIFQEKIGQVEINKDSTFTFYQKYYNPFLLEALSKFYSRMALNGFYQLLKNYQNYPTDLYNFLVLELATMLEEQEHCDKTLALLKQLQNSNKQDYIQGFAKILSFNCKNRLSPREINISKRLDALNKPILQSYFLYKVSQLGYTYKERLLAKYFNFDRLNRSQQLTCSEYLGNYFLEIHRYDKAQAYYQRRLLGGSFDLNKNAPLFLIHFVKAFYFNELNRDQGLWILRKLTRVYPAIKQVEQLYASILAEKIFK